MSEEQNNNKEEQKIKRGKNFDVFISYRRSDGTVKAKALDLAFSMDDCRTFLDFKSLGTGAFDKRLENAVLDAPIFIMVWTPDYFKRCVKEGEKTKNEDDWVRKEIELALANGKKIIPINYDEGMDKVPDYLDEELKTKLGVHNVVNLHGDNTFDDTVKGIFDREIRPFIGAAPKPENKVNVRVKADADCELIDNDEVIATIQQGKTAQLFFERGEYELIARSTAFPKIYDVIKRAFDDVSFNYLIKVELAERVIEYRDDIVGPGLCCAPPPKEDIKINEQKKRLEEERRRAEQARLDAEKAEAERIAREKAEAEERRREAEQREEEVEQREEEAELRKAERKAWWQRHKSKFAIALAVIALSVTGLLIYLNWDYSLKTITEHSKYVNSVSLSPDGKYLASGSGDETLIIWNANSGQRLKTLKGHSGSVGSVCWSPDGKHLASGSEDKTVIIWDAESGEKLKTLEGHSHWVKSVSWSPDGKYLASGSWDETVIIWDAKSGQRLKTLKGHSGSVRSVCWSPDGKYLASGAGDAFVIIWDAESGEKLKTLAGHYYSVYSVSWSPDGKYLASGSGDKTLIIWDATSGQKLKTLKGHSSFVESVCWSPDGKYLASGSWDETVIIWDAKSGEKLKTLKGHSDEVNSVCWSPDGKYLASGSADETVKIWGVE